jgi:hypothetical protein
MKNPIRLFVSFVACCLFGSALAQESKPDSPATKSRQSGVSVQANSQAVAVVVPARSVNTNEYNPSTDKSEAATCKQNLEKINAALQDYRKDNNDAPNWLFDLVPKYITDTNILICPVTTRTGLQSAFGVLDPRVYSSYLYEFTPTDIPEVVKGAWPGPKMTMRDWKRQQMKLAGSQVPLVRCLLHEPALNLSIGGKIYESPVFWELNFTNSTTKLEDFSPH